MDNDTLRKALDTAAAMVASQISAQADPLIKAVKASYNEWASEEPPGSGGSPFKFPIGVSIKITPAGKEADVTVAVKWGIKYTAEGTGHVSSEPELPMGDNAN